MSINKKILFVGSVGSGKSTIVKNLSSVDVITSEVGSTIDIGKSTTTVGIDYGYISLDKDNKISLYGVPGQRKYSFVWDYVKQSCWGIVILVKKNDVKSLQELDYLLDYFEVNQATPLIICLTHSDIYKSDECKKYIDEVLEKRQLNVPVYSIDANLQKNATLIIQTLTAMEETSSG